MRAVDLKIVSNYRFQEDIYLAVTRKVMTEVEDKIMSGIEDFICRYVENELNGEIYED